MGSYWDTEAQVISVLELLRQIVTEHCFFILISLQLLIFCSLLVRAICQEHNFGPLS